MCIDLHNWPTFKTECSSQDAFDTNENKMSQAYFGGTNIGVLCDK